VARRGEAEFHDVPYWQRHETDERRRAIAAPVTDTGALNADPSGQRADAARCFDEALTVFKDPLARIFDDPDHSDEEPREIIIGHSSKPRLILVCFTERQGKIRIINARRATKRERQDYEQNTK
jgi:uncharacterized protein